MRPSEYSNPKKVIEKEHVFFINVDAIDCGRIQTHWPKCSVVGPHLLYADLAGAFSNKFGPEFSASE
jgi:hypothetical protein